MGDDVDEHSNAHRDLGEGHLWFLERLDLVNRAIQKTTDLDQMMREVLDTTIGIFAGDRSWLAYPGDPDGAAWRVSMERTRTACPGAPAPGQILPVDPYTALMLHVLAGAGRAVTFGPGCEHCVPELLAKEYSVRTFIAVALYPKSGVPWVFGLHHCAGPRDWTQRELRLFEEIGPRLAGALASLSAYRSLRERERQLEEAQRVAHVGYWERDLQNGCITWSDEAFRIFGLPVQQQTFSMSKVEEILHPDDRKTMADAVKVALRGGPRFDVECRVVRPGGEVRVIQSQGDLTRDETGRAVRMFGTVQDITERRRIKEALRASEEQSRLALEVADVATWWYDVRSDALHVDARCQARYGFGQPEVRMGDLTARLHPDDADRVGFEIAAAHDASGNGSFASEHRIILPWGDVRWLAVRAHVHFSGDGPARRPEKTIGTTLDITARKRAEETLRASEQRFRTFVDHATDAFFLHDDQSRVLDVNQEACDSLGYSREALIGMNPFGFDVDVTADTLARIVGRLAGGEIVTIDTRHRRADGSVFPVEVRIRGFWEGGRMFSVSMAHDISERKRAQESFTLFRSLIDHANDSIEVVDPDTGRYLDVNETACRIHGYTREEYLSRTVADMDPMMSAKPLRESIGGILEAGSGVRESLHRRKDGSEFPVEVNIAFIRLDRDYVLAIVRDITERKQAEEALIQSHGLLNTVVEGTPDAIFVKDLNGRYLMMNSAGARFLGKAADEVVGKDDWELFTPDTAANVMESDRRVLATGEAQVFEETATAAGVTRTYLATKGVYRDAHGKPLGTIGISRDITEVKRLEEQFRQAQKMEAVGRLAGGVAHDFNNLLTVINGNSELAFGFLRPDDPSRELLAQIQQASERATALTRQLLAFSRKQILQPQCISLNRLLGELLKLLQRLIGENVEVSLAPGADPGLAKVDPGQFEQAIINLSVNARDAMPQGGRLAIETRNAELDADYAGGRADVLPGQYVLVSVSDSGHGMDEETRRQIFEPFFTTKEMNKGTGLGLAMVYGFVKQSGGHIDVSSEVGKGTTFEIYLPRAREGERAAATAPAALASPMGSETILLVEDEDAVRTLARRVLQSGGYTVLEARDGQEAIWIAQQHPAPIHLLVTDVVMPRMSGLQVAEYLVRARPSVRILFISGYADAALDSHGATGANVAFLQKPFNAMALARKVRETLDTKTRAD